MNGIGMWVRKTKSEFQKERKKEMEKQKKNEYTILFNHYCHPFWGDQNGNDIDNCYSHTLTVPSRIFIGHLKSPQKKNLKSFPQKMKSFQRLTYLVEWMIFAPWPY